MLGKVISSIRAKDKKTRDFYALMSASLLTALIVTAVLPGYFIGTNDSGITEAGSEESVGFGSYFSRLKSEFGESFNQNNLASLNETSTSTTSSIVIDTLGTSTSIVSTTSNKFVPAPRTIRIATTTTASSSDEQAD